MEKVTQSNAAGAEQSAAAAEELSAQAAQLQVVIGELLSLVTGRSDTPAMRQTGPVRPARRTEWFPAAPRHAYRERPSHPPSSFPEAASTDAGADTFFPSNEGEAGPTDAAA